MPPIPNGADAQFFVPRNPLHPPHDCGLCDARGFQTTGDLGMHIQRGHWTDADRARSAKLHHEVAHRRQAMGLSPIPEFPGRHERLH